MPLRNNIGKIKREPPFFTCSNLLQLIKAAHQNNTVREKIQQQLNFARFLIFFLLSSEVRCDRQVCERLARFVIDEGEEGY